MAIHPINGLSICAGIGGLDIGLRIAMGGRYRTVCYVERESYVAAQLVAGMENEALDSAPIWDDLECFPSADFRGIVDIISGGFPCQPWSVAGKQAGEADERWLWPAIADIIRDVGPRYVFLENVPGLITGRGLEPVLGSLAELGFDAEWTVLGASDVGAPHHRRRVFILAYRAGECGELLESWRRGGFAECGCEDLADASSARRDRREDSGASPKDASEGTWRREPQRDCADLADPRNGQLSATEWRAQQRAGFRQTGAAVVDAENTDRRRTGEPSYAGRWTSQNRGSSGVFPPGPHDYDRWRELLVRRPELRPSLSQAEIESYFRGIADGTTDWRYRLERLRCLGNAVVPIQAAAAFVELVERVN